MLVLVSACNQQAEIGRAQTAESHQSNMAMAPQNRATKQSTNYHQTSKPHAAITMRYELLNSVAIDQALDVKLVFRVGHSVESLQVKILSKAGLVVLSAQTDFLFNNLPKGALQAFVLKVKPEQFGEHVLNITATINTVDANQSRTFEIPINLYSKNQSAKTTNKAQKGTTFHPEQNVISMPASER